MAAQFGVTIETIARWRRAGIVHARPRNDHGEYLFQPPEEEVLMRCRKAANGLAQLPVRVLATEGV